VRDDDEVGGWSVQHRQLRDLLVRSLRKRSGAAAGLSPCGLSPSEPLGRKPGLSARFPAHRR
jgi:hypothetical protein